MNWSEIFPVVSGLLLGTLLGGVTPRSRKGIGVPIVLLLAFLATVLSGEFRISWGFVLVDLPLVSIPALAAFVLQQRVSCTPNKTS
jgi:hypothetical protein